MALKADDRILLIMRDGYITIFTGRGDMVDFEIVADAVRPKLLIRLKDEDGNDTNMASGTATFSMVNYRTGANKINAASMAIDTGSEGKISYNWSDASVTDTVGTFIGRVTATISGGSAHPIVELIKIKVVRKLPT